MGDRTALSERDEVHVLAIVRYLVKARSFIDVTELEEPAPVISFDNLPKLGQ